VDLPPEIIANLIPGRIVNPTVSIGDLKAVLPAIKGLVHLMDPLVPIVLIDPLPREIVTGSTGLMGPGLK